MTTIAYKDGVIAYDSRQTRSGSIVSDDCQKLTVVDGVSFFLSGAVCDERALIAAYFGTPSPVPVECSGYVVDGGRLQMVGHDDKTGVWRQDLDPTTLTRSAAARPMPWQQWTWAQVPKRQFALL